MAIIGLPVFENFGVKGFSFLAL